MDRTALLLLLCLCGSGLQAEHMAALPGEVRLAEGGGRCAGRLEMKDRGNWTAADEVLLNFVQNLTSAAAVCRQLDCGSVVSLQRITARSDAPELSVFHSLNVFQHHQIPAYTVKITCSDSLRLVNGSDPCSGRLEVKSNLSWSSVSEAGFYQRDAEVVCRELNCGAPLVLQGALFGDSETMLNKEFRCKGHELALLDCDSSVRQYSGKAVGLTCSEPDDVRLVGGSSRCAGTLEVRQGGEWKPAYTDSWTLEFAGEVCQQLDCGSAVSTRKKSTSGRDIWRLTPDCGDSGILKCPKKLKQSSSSTEITCSDSVRLVNGSNSCSGRLEVRSQQLWAPVCENDLDQQDAEVVCRQLNCGAPSALRGGRYGGAGAPAWSKEFHCEGSEAELLSCSSSSTARDACPGQAAGLTCSDPRDSVRLVGGASRCSGKLQVKHDGDWKHVMNRGFAWSVKETGALCQLLDCGSYVFMTFREHEAKEPVLWVNSSCIQLKAAFKECVTVQDSQSDTRIEMTCSDSVRLVNGSNSCSGRLEVRSQQLWAPVCENDLDQQDAEVVCRQLNCGAPSALRGGRYGGAGAPAWSKEFHCEGSEAELLSCSSSSTARDACPGQAAGLTCSDNFRLKGGASRCAGMLEMKNLGEWRPVADLDYMWDQDPAAGVCARLGCGTAVSAEMTDDSPVRPVWWIQSSCVRAAATLQECVTASYPEDSEFSLELTCSDLLVQPTISLSHSPYGVSNATNQGSQVLVGSGFGITCSVKPQYQGGSFQLTFSASRIRKTYILPAVNHSALFLFPAADHTHQGTYSCSYRLHIFSHNFSSTSQLLRLTVGAPLTDFIIRLVLLGMMLSILVLCYRSKVRRGQKLQKPKREINHRLDGSGTGLEEETSASW